jgi:dienelactone hydrolase
MSFSGFLSAVTMLVLMALAGDATAAPDYAREKRLADEVAPSLVAGDAVTLETAAGRKFLGILTPAQRGNSPRVSVILIHGLGAHPDFGLIGALRMQLADRGYTTLSIQMPVLAAAADAQAYTGVFPEAGERIEAALDYLRSKGTGKIAIVAHSMGARMANDFLAHRPDAPIIAWVPLAISSGEFELIKGARFPVFDIYAQKDLEGVLQGAKARAEVLRRMHGSKQAMVYGADHYFAHKEKEVAALIDGLLGPLAK